MCTRMRGLIYICMHVWFKSSPVTHRTMHKLRKLRVGDKCGVILFLERFSFKLDAAQHVALINLINREEGEN